MADIMPEAQAARSLRRRALPRRPVTVGRERGLPLSLPGGSALRMTVHPSCLLRLRERSDRERQYRGVVDDLRAAAGA